ncbi:MAG: imidazoleglycerol-phosphate dehydratase HisB [Candidatus Aureabacteria bacterium]|nr:imidazoleglycerol-phosphate dehydratase HisB [Candidatus Auribacterota bacterium]
MKKRMAEIKRKTRETDIRLRLALDGAGRSRVRTGIGIMDHMLELFAKHSGIDLELAARGDLRVDDHHTVEDIGICLGQGLGRALGQKEGIERYGFCTLPMDEALVSVSLDLSGRSHLRYDVNTGRRKIGAFDPQMVEEFLQAMVNNAGITLHVELITGKNPHHVVEAVFKGLGRSLRTAMGRTGKGVPSTKGTLSR